MKGTGSLLALFVFLSVALVADADLPVHCPHHTIKGSWEFTMSKGNQDKSLMCNQKPKESSMCFYGSCYTNKVLGEPKFKKDMKWKVSLTDPNVAIATDQNGKKHKGSWTVVYDEGFEVNVKDRKFFAFSKFAKGKSHCKETWPGWHRDAKNPDKQAWGCYTGSKTSEEIDEDDLALLSAEEFLQESGTVKATKAYEQPPVAPSTPKMYQPEHDLVARINKKAKTWKAKVYPEFEKYTLAEFQRRMGFKPHAHVDTRPRRPEGTETLVDVSALPEHFDWRKKDGQDYVDPVVDQGACGSCYAVATTSMLNSRVRIQTKNRVKPSLKWGQVLSCNRYSQGCAGGFPYLVEKYAQDFGLTKSGKCAKSAQQLKELGEGAGDNTPYIRAKNFGYVGGYYGGTTTAEMMHEVYHNGPIVVGINGGYELMHYESGIFIQTGEGEGAGKVKNDFEKVDHAVLVVGWGADKNEKYWIIKNSFGANWGDHGYFKIKRGADQYGITSLVTAATPVLAGASYFNDREADELIQESEELLKSAA